MNVSPWYLYFDGCDQVLHLHLEAEDQAEQLRPRRREHHQGNEDEYKNSILLDKEKTMFENHNYKE